LVYPTAHPTVDVSDTSRSKAIADVFHTFPCGVQRKKKRSPQIGRNHQESDRFIRRKMGMQSINASFPHVCSDDGEINRKIEISTNKAMTKRNKANQQL